MMRGDGPPEAPLWDHLDRCGIAFREPASALIAQYGTHPLGWRDGADICLLEGTHPFLKGQADPVAFDVTGESDLSLPPQVLRCALRETPDFRLNYARAIARLVKLFGEGRETPTETTVGRRWEFGRASISCWVTPPARLRDRPPSKRILMFPDRATEATIHITPGFLGDPD